MFLEPCQAIILLIMPCNLKNKVQRLPYAIRNDAFTYSFRGRCSRSIALDIEADKASITVRNIRAFLDRDNLSNSAAVLLCVRIHLDMLVTVWNTRYKA